MEYLSYRSDFQCTGPDTVGPTNVPARGKKSKVHCKHDQVIELVKFSILIYDSDFSINEECCFSGTSSI